MRRLPLLLLALLLAACPQTPDDDDSVQPDDDDTVLPDDDDTVLPDDDDSAPDDDDAVDDDDAGDDDDSAAADAFEMFRITESFGPCPKDTDCWGYVELRSDLLLRIDVLGEQPEQVHEVKVPPSALAEALPALVDAELVAILASDELPCMIVDDVYELMEITLDGVTHSNETTMCDLAPIVAARQTMDELASTYGPR